MTIVADRPLRGMTWSHVRGRGPLIEACALTGIDVEWQERSLAEFEDVPVVELAEQYDLIAIDHPFVGQAAATGALMALDEMLPTAVLAEHRDGVVGPSAASYYFDGHQWALAMDAAAQVSAWLPGTMNSPPDTWDAVIEMLQRRPNGLHPAMPANPTHLFSSFLSLCHDTADPALRAADVELRPTWWGADGIEPEIAAVAIGRLIRLLDLLDPRSLEMDPIDILEEMSGGGPANYAPLIFGYSNYARDGFRKEWVRFGDTPGTTGTMTGGVGLAISARCADPERALRLATFIVSADFQPGGYVHSGGQPALRKAWIDERVNAVSHGFFAGTLATLDNGFLRGRDQRYPAFQRDAGRMLHDLLKHRSSPRVIAEDLNSRWRSR